MVAVTDKKEASPTMAGKKKPCDDQDTGFSLVEIMAVVSIVGILIAVVFASFGTTRAKAVDKAIKSTLMGIQLRAVGLFEQYGCYTWSGGNCSAGTSPSPSFYVSCDSGQLTGYMFRDPNVLAMLTEVGNRGGGGLSSLLCSVSYDKLSWAVAAPLKSDPVMHYCVDSKKYTREIALPSGPGTLGVNIFTDASCKSN
jgi:prepilin-type N-terminal cleavage/methylation domain-containing protein